MKQTLKCLCGDSLELLKQYDANTFDSVVTDPPYGLSFLGKKWDYDVPTVEMWEEVLRVLKPGGHLLSFGGSRTYHRMTVNVEDAGFEIRDQIMWIYGSGFPKSHNIGKAYAKTNYGENPHEGWGTALKPAHEPIVLARKPLSEKTIVDNVIKWVTGGLNIDGSRVPIEGKDTRSAGNRTATFGTQETISGGDGSGGYTPSDEGRFPANIIHDGKEVILSKFFYSAKVSPKEKQAGLEVEIKSNKRPIGVAYNNQGGVNTDDRVKAGNTHPTVKPVALMAYLCKLVTPKGGMVLDPFMGSGSTGMAAKQEGFSFTGIDLDENYVEISTNRIKNWV